MMLAAASLALLLVSTPYQQTPTTQCENSTVDTFGPITAAAARAFLMDLQQAVAKDHRKVVAGMVKYPVLVQLNGHPTRLKTEALFLRHYSEIFTPAVKQAIQSQSTACLGYASSGYTPEFGSTTSFVIGSHGEVWFDSSTERGPFKIITIND